MSYLAALVVLVGIVALLDLLLTAAVIRRLREHESRLSELAGPGPHPSLGLLRPGSHVPEFAATTVDGLEVSHQELPTRPTVLAFLRASCQPCQGLLPDLAGYAADEPGRRDRVLAFVTGDQEAAAGMVERLGEVASVVSGLEADRTVEAFAVSGYPTLYAVAGGEVRAAGTTMADLAPGLATSG